MQPFISSCVIFRDNFNAIDNLLKSVDGCFDEYVFCDTGSKDGTRQKVESFLVGKSGKVIDFEWVDDFAKARQASFEAATGKWRMFLDSDDTLVNGESLKPFLVQCEMHRPQMEAVFFGYDYAQNEWLDTMRACRWREGWAWTDAIHERLEFHPYALPSEAFGKLQEIHVKHVYKTDEEKVQAIRRNGIIARREYATSTDTKYRARLARTIAMELKMDGKAAETEPYLVDLYNHYATYPEGRQAAADMMKAKMMLSQFTAAFTWAKRAGPSYEAISLHALKDYRGSLHACQRGTGRGPQTTHEGLLFEQGAAFIAAADSAYELKMGPNNGADVAERLIDHIPAKFRNDKVLVESVQAIRNRVDRITIVVPFTPQPFDETGGGGMLGGSEEAVLYLTEALVKLGRKVRIYAPLPPQRIPGVDDIGRDWQPYASFNLNAEHGTLVIWRAWALAVQLLEARARGEPMPGIMGCWMWLHDTHAQTQPQAMEALSRAMNGAVVLSDFHADAIRQQGFAGNMVKLSNGIVEKDFEPYIDSPDFGFDYCPARDPNRVVYSSDASRGLYQLLEMWPSVKAACPEAYLDIYYDWAMLEAMQPENYLRIKNKYESVKHLDVIHHGGVDHQTLHHALRNANVWAYSHFESPLSETFCISAVKAQACGATVLSVPNGALAEVTAGDAILVTDPNVYREKLIELLKIPEPVEKRRKIAHAALKRYGWMSVAEKFSKAWSFFRPSPANEPPTSPR